MLRSAAGLFAQALLYAAFALLLGYFATMPNYEYADAGSATVKVSLSHAADLVKPCVPLTQEEIAALAANMRRSETCERERLPLVLELEIDGRPVLQVEARPSGLWSDGPGSIYERFEVAPGEHRVAVRLRDSARVEGWDYARDELVTLQAGRYFTVTFHAEKGGFVFR